MRGAASKSDLHNQVTKIYLPDKKSFFPDPDQVIQTIFSTFFLNYLYFLLIKIHDIFIKM